MESDFQLFHCALLHILPIYFFCGGKFQPSVCKSINPLPDAALCRSTSIHHTLQFYAKCELVGAGPLHLAYARPFGRLKAPLGLSLLRFAAQTRTTLFLLCTKSYIVWRKIGVRRGFRWKFFKRKSLKLLGTSRSFRLFSCLNWKFTARSASSWGQVKEGSQMALFPFISLSMRLPFSLSRTSPYATLHNLPAIWCKSGVVVGVVDFRPKCPVYRSDLQRNGLWLPWWLLRKSPS